MRARADRGRRGLRGRIHARARAMSEPRRGDWDDRHRGQPPGEAEPFLAAMLARIPRGVALDVAAGRGRNALALARAGMQVLAGGFSAESMRVLAGVARRAPRCIL